MNQNTSQRRGRHRRSVELTSTLVHGDLNRQGSGRHDSRVYEVTSRHFKDSSEYKEQRDKVKARADAEYAVTGAA